MKRIAAALLGLMSVASLATTNTLSSVSGGKVKTSHVNQFFLALNQDLVPRNSSGVPTSVAGSLGDSTYPWLQVFLGSGATVIDEVAGNVRVTGLQIGASGAILSKPAASRLRVADEIQISDGPILVKKSDGSAYLKKSDASQSYPLVVSAEPSSTSLKIVRGFMTNCTTNSGEGFSCAVSATGRLDITFSTAFSDIPSCVCSVVSGGSVAHTQYCSVELAAVGSVRVMRGESGSGLTAGNYHFICIGQR